MPRVPVRRGEGTTDKSCAGIGVGQRHSQEAPESDLETSDDRHGQGQGESGVSTYRQLRHDNDEASANEQSADTLSPLQQTIRWGMARLAHEIRREHPNTDMLAARLMVIGELKREVWGDE